MKSPFSRVVGLLGRVLAQGILILAIPCLILPFLFLFLFAACLGGVFMWQRIRELQRMQRWGWPNQLSRYTEPGTFLVYQEFSQKRAIGQECWWTPLDVETEFRLRNPNQTMEWDELQSEVEADSDTDAFNRWCYRELISLEHGSAILFASRHGAKKGKQLHCHRPGSKIVHVWSPLFFFHRIDEALILESEMPSPSPP